MPFPAGPPRHLSVPGAAPADGTRSLIARGRDQEGRRIMIRHAILLVLAIDLANGQLNYEGNPFTEYTEYIAQESSLSERSARRNDASIDLPSSEISRLRKPYPVVESEDDGRSQQAAETDNLLKSQISPSVQTFLQSDAIDTSARQFQDQSSRSHAEVALNSFLNSRTPEESRMSLDHYLRSQQPPEDQSRSSDAVVGQESSRPIEASLDPQRQPVSYVQQQQPLLVPQVNQQQGQLTSQVDQVQLVPQLVPQTDQRQQLLPPTGQAYGYAGQPVAVQPVIRTPAGVVLGQKILQPVPLVPAYQARNDIITQAMWRERMRRVRGKPYPFAQPRIAALYQGPIAVPMKGKTPVEVIYTKPPGFHRGPPVISNPPVPYEDAGAWFPNADYPPPSHKDVYYSQLYAQSYDPHYYNYIAATGKVRPHLYGKMGKHQEEQGDGIWTELFRGFAKHGLKNIMTPTFLLGMTLPVVTLMLSALVQKRSIARSGDARELDRDSALQEYLERLQRAMECYAGRSPRDGKLDGC